MEAEATANRRWSATVKLHTTEISKKNDAICKLRSELLDISHKLKISQNKTAVAEKELELTKSHVSAYSNDAAAEEMRNNHEFRSWCIFERDRVTHTGSWSVQQSRQGRCQQQ